MVFKPVFATFKGKHNESKSKALLCLWDAKQRGLSGLSLKLLAFESSVSYAYLKARLGKWHSWGYVARYITKGRLRPVFSYKIAARGERFLDERVPHDVLARYIEEMHAYKERRLMRPMSRLRLRLDELERSRLSKLSRVSR